MKPSDANPTLNPRASRSRWRNPQRSKGRLIVTAAVVAVVIGLAIFLVARHAY